MAKLKVSILKKNVRQLMRDKNITQEELAKKIGSTQSGVAKYLSEKNTDKFNLEHLYEIATEYHVSIDSLLGLKLSEKNDDTSLGDVVSLLAQLEKIEPFKFGKVTYEESTYIPNDFDSDFDTTRETVAIHYDLSTEGGVAIDTLITEWKEATKLCEHSPIGEDIKKIWIEKQLERGRKKLKKYGYRTKEEESERLLERLKKEYDEWERSQGGDYAHCELPGVWWRGEIELLEEYAIKHPYAMADFENALNLAKKSNGFMEIPDGIDEELPFN
ncbi:transcriptional regulator with XRE-family HTH domain [Lachnospiraceae bacterium PM6-15]|uniref:helix-turn-helix domain-containing protein n=1 Tax=Ohessyouella blattaphilus TaxID=2949333 RepID=UPI003E2EAC79